MSKPDFLVIGGGVIGLSIAIRLKRKYGGSVAVMEKEPHSIEHASGRNSGVIHAGFYYSADSLKAKFTRDGNRMWHEYIAEKKLPLNECGKIVVAQSESEIAGLEELLRRGKVNGVELAEIDVKQAKEIEPRVKTHEKALWSPTTSTCDPKACMAALVQDCEDSGIEMRYGSPYRGQKEIDAGYVVNAAGLYADKIAKDYGFSDHLTIVPFKGLYLYSSEPDGAIHTNIYPVPNLNNPFLGVHYTITVDGHAKIGPTAIPAFWRENYKGLAGINLAEMAQIVGIETKLMFKAGFDFRGLAMQEVRKYWRPYLVGQAAMLLEGVQAKDYKKWGKAGIRAQLMDVRSRKLIMDFCVEGDEKSFHVLNAVSPGFTCAFPFADFCVDEIDAKAHRGASAAV
ncbi:MAG TPA: FAD-dependent oxidoreductase [Fimbriimonadaceae bacterium]|nr:FAD-dependent oxidoreductase [Fimbriimonadaceae bacterium]